MKVNFGTKVKSTSSACLGGKDKKLKKWTPPKQKDGNIVNFKATVYLKPGWMKKEMEDAQLLGMLFKIFTGPNIQLNRTRSELCQMVFGRPVVSQEEEDKLDRAMWELHRYGIVTLENRKVE